jgi:hypothetical protein
LDTLLLDETTAIGRTETSPRVVCNICEGTACIELYVDRGLAVRKPELASVSCSPETIVSRFSSTGPPSRV